MIASVKPSEASEPHVDLPQTLPAFTGLQVSPETTDRVSNLLAEYSEKLKAASRELEKRQDWLATGLIIVGAAVCLYVMVQTNSSETPGAAEPLWRLVSVLFMGFAVGTFVGWRDAKKERVLRANLKVNAEHLERAVRTASQIHEHAERDMGRRLELDLRLAEAETLLNYVRLQTGQKK